MNEENTNAERSRTHKARLEARGGRKVNVILERAGNMALQRLERAYPDKRVKQIVEEALVAHVKSRRFL